MQNAAVATADAGNAGNGSLMQVKLSAGGHGEDPSSGSPVHGEVVSFEVNADGGEMFEFPEGATDGSN